MQKEYYQEIDLINMLHYILRRWRKVLGIAIIFMIVVPSIMYCKYKFVDSNSSLPSNSVPQEITESSADSLELVNLQLKSEAIIKQSEVLRQIVDQQKEYLDNSIIFKMDPYKVSYENASFMVKSVSEDDISSHILNYSLDEIIALYVDNMYKDIDYTTLEDKYNVDAKYIKELFSIGANYSNNTISIHTQGIDEIMAKDVMDVVIAILDEEYDVVKGKTDTDFTIKELARYNGTEIVQKYLTDKNSLINSIVANNNTIVNNEKNLKDNEDAIKKLDDKLVLGTAVQSSKSMSTSQLMKYALIGMLVGTFVVVAYYAVVYIFQAKLRTDGDIKCMDLEVLGIIWANKEYKGIFAFVDKFIDKIFGIKDASKNAAIIERIGYELSSLEDVKSIAAVSTIKDTMEIADKLSKTQKDVLVKAAYDYLADNKSIELVKQEKNCILIEYANISKIKDIQQEIIELKRLGKEIKGVIVVNS